MFYSVINIIIDKYVPKITIGGTYSYPVWYSRALISVIKEKSKAHTQWKKYENPHDYATFALLRDRQKKLQKECHKNYLYRSQENIKTSPKNFWAYVKSRKKNKSNYPKYMTYDNNQLTSETEICKAFNDFFYKNFSSSLGAYTSFSADCETYGDTLHSLTTDSACILKLLQNLDTSKGPGNDNIPPLFFVKCAESLSSPIAYIFNRCFHEGYCPTVWKIAHIVPIHKKGCKNLIENYRPISILNVLGKIMEKIVHNVVYPTISKLIPQQQHGFIKGRSTNTNLAVFLENIVRDMDGGGQVDVIYTDFEKAFDRVDHVILLRKLQELGIRGNLLRWFESYLRNRSQIVKLGGVRSNCVTIPSGVPQGSILAPLLYSAYLYDIGAHVLDAGFLMYADDTKIFMTIGNMHDCEKLQNDLNRLSNYYNINRINVNITKCQTVTFTRKRNFINYTYKLSGGHVVRCNVIRDLGVVLDSKLLLSEHVSCIVGKAYRNLGFIKRTCKLFTDINCIKILYFAYIRSILEYCSNIWNPPYLVYIQQIESIQSKFIKYINYRTGFKSNDYLQSCKHHNILPLENRRMILDMLFVYNVCSGNIESTALNDLVLRLSAPSRRTRHTQLFDVPHSGTNYAQNTVVGRILRNFNKKFSHLDIFNTKKGVFRKLLVTSVCDELTNNSK